MPEEAPPKEIVPEKDMKPLMDEVDRILAEIGGPEGAPEGGPEGAEAPLEGEVVEEEVVEDEGDEPVGPDVSVLAERLEIDEAKARALYDAAQQLGRTEGMSPEELAEALLIDMQLRMELEKIAGSIEDISSEDAAMALEMAPAEGAPAGPPAGMPPEMPPM
jgi:hypothetical protein